MIARLMAHPWYDAYNAVCKAFANVGTIIWSAIVLCKPGTIAASTYPQIGAVPEGVTACGLFLLSGTQLVWLIAHWKPLRWCNAGYGVLTLFWASVFTLMLINGPVHPEAIAGVFLILFLAASAFHSREEQGCGVAS